MKFKNDWKSFAVGIFIGVVLCMAMPAFAAEHYLAPGHPDGIVVLPPPPIPGSPEADADMATSRAAFKSRTEAQTALAKKDESLSFNLFDAALGSNIHIKNLPKTSALLGEVRSEIALAINAPKDHYKRLRPYQIDPGLKWGSPEASASYPSGHSTRGTVYSMVLAEVFPDKSEPLLAIGRQIGWDRVLIGKHFLSDVQAGRVLGRAIVHELEASPAFQKDLAAAREEAQKAESASTPASKTTSDK